MSTRNCAKSPGENACGKRRGRIRGARGRSVRGERGESTCVERGRARAGRAGERACGKRGESPRDRPRGARREPLREKQNNPCGGLGLHMSLVFQGSPAGQTRVLTIPPPRPAPRYYSLKSIFTCAIIIPPPRPLSSTRVKKFLCCERQRTISGRSSTGRHQAIGIRQ